MGKTELAEATALELGRPFFRARVSNVASGFVSRGEKCLAKLFRTARDQRGVIFFDEGEKLLGDPGREEQASASVASEFKTWLQNKPEDGVIVFLATNFPELVSDSAVLRRFGLKLYVGLPLPRERTELIGFALDRIFPDSPERGTLKVRVEHDADLGPRLTLGYTQDEILRIVDLVVSSLPTGLDHVKELRFRNVYGNVYKPLNSRTDAVVATDLTPEQFENAAPPGARVLWAMPTLEQLKEGFESGMGVVRSVSPETLERLAEFAAHTLMDADAAQRIRGSIRDIESLPGTTMMAVSQ